MATSPEKSDESILIAQRWCAGKGAGWSVCVPLGEGGTAPVFEIVSPDGIRALKIYDAKFSAGKKGQIEQKRIDQQLALKEHDCPYLVQVYEGGRFEERLYLLMSRAPGKELEKRLTEVPRNKIRQIVDQIARAAMFLKSRGLCHRDIKAANVFISDDFEHCTLLDISVIRDVTDPIGVGTDHDGQLPVVATARYSPPEYLFRLLEPGPELWHALNVYQLGALLHDLIMRESLFQDEYLKSAENRYRFAWIIALADPPIRAEDVDRDLMLTARRALDKNWQRRSGLRLEDFLADANVQQAHALQILGLGIVPGSLQGADDLTARLQRVREVAADLEDRVVKHLRDNGVRAKHEIQPGSNDMSKVIVFHWDAPASERGSASRQVELRLNLELLLQPQGFHFGLSARLATRLDAEDIQVALALPELQDEPGVEPILFGHAVDALEKLAVEITRLNVAEEEA
jgi:serine/threonine protein kinase